MYEIPRRKCAAPRCAGLLVAALLLVAATRGFCAEDMQKIGSGITIPGEEQVTGVDCYCWPPNHPDGTPQEDNIEPGGSADVQMPQGTELWVGLISGAGSASWTLEVSSFAAAWEDDEWMTNEVWKVDSLTDNRIAPNDSGLQSCAKGSVPVSIYKKLGPVDGTDADVLRVNLNSNPSGNAGFRIIVFAKKHVGVKTGR
ncbi:MAG TPA: hypothetical protein VMH22_01995 [bacterium]|nr:hypothetical protein [bacterium]